ncbi:DoxX family membrane protein [Mucilaginibacter pallidiroseus]|uniref:DoxX family membrane protein n=1 Tax=Mucilaginibacter pallidiroseus TaxID=2599295 RepID=A0A563U1R3_9SPHI|nr:FAD-dependent oxidoreductase [Mucilaginibacter pallidiroseus]TWR24389.1 DoxX family membrane protein [Mucilaginibacter pallidiroseus]
MKKRLVIIGGGFSGFWSALSAVRQSRKINKRDEVEIAIIHPDEPFIAGPRLYKTSPHGLSVELLRYTVPLGITLITGRVEKISPETNEISVVTIDSTSSVSYDYLVLSTGSVLKRSDVSGIEHTFNVESFDAARKLEQHLEKLAREQFRGKGATTLVVVGSGQTGLEILLTIVEKANSIAKRIVGLPPPFKAINIEKLPDIASSYSAEGQDYIRKAIEFQNIEVFTGTEVTSVDPGSIRLSSGDVIATKTVIWAAGMEASSLTSQFSGERDKLNRLKVDAYLKLPEYRNVILSGDVATIDTGNGETFLMATQYSNFEGRWAGHNAINDLFDLPLKEYSQTELITCFDLGENNRLLTVDRDHKVELTGREAHDIKVYLNTRLMYPPADAEDAVKASYPESPKLDKIKETYKCSSQINNKQHFQSNKFLMKKKDYAQLLLRLSIGLGFLSAVMDRIGWLGAPGGQNINWGNWQNFIAYTQMLMPWSPADLTKILGLIATIGEAVFGLLLILGYKTKWNAMGACLLTLIFIICMVFTAGTKAVFNYSVPSVCAGAFLLSAFNEFRWSIDNIYRESDSILR